MMGDTYADIKENAEKEYYAMYSQIIMSIESEMTEKQWADVLEDTAKPYWIMIDGAPFVQVISTRQEFFVEKMAIKSKADKAFISEQLLSDVDKNNDGKIDQEEWLHLRGVSASKSTTTSRRARWMKLMPIWTKCAVRSLRAKSNSLPEARVFKFALLRGPNTCITGTACEGSIRRGARWWLGWAALLILDKISAMRKP